MDPILNLQLVAETGPCVIVEFRGQKLVERKYVDSKTGKAAEFRYVSVSAEMLTGDRRQITLEFVPPRGVEKLDLFPLERGAVCVAGLSSYLEKDGHATARLRTLEPAATGPLKVQKEAGK